MTALPARKKQSCVIRGDSVAAWCCVHLLTKAGFDPVLERSARPRLPAIVLSDAALLLVRDVFEKPSLSRLLIESPARLCNGAGTPGQ
jgi:hypothetical protein